MNITDLQVRATETGLEVRLHIQPRAKRPGIAGIHNGALKIKVTAPPVDDAANRAVIEFFATLLEIPKSSIQIVSGLKAREKTLEIRGLSRSDFFVRAGLTP
ncbi:MAG: YggU family protein [Acidobacteria bacterium]|nr:YggU family protein [Acidobacteriota bacterium]